MEESNEAQPTQEKISTSMYDNMASEEEDGDPEQKDGHEKEKEQNDKQNQLEFHSTTKNLNDPFDNLDQDETKTPDPELEVENFDLVETLNACMNMVYIYYPKKYSSKFYKFSGQEGSIGKSIEFDHYVENRRGNDTCASSNTTKDTGVRHNNDIKLVAKASDLNSAYRNSPSHSSKKFSFLNKFLSSKAKHKTGKEKDKEKSSKHHKNHENLTNSSKTPDPSDVSNKIEMSDSDNLISNSNQKTTSNKFNASPCCFGNPCSSTYSSVKSNQTVLAEQNQIDLELLEKEKNFKMKLLNYLYDQEYDFSQLESNKENWFQVNLFLKFVKSNIFRNTNYDAEEIKGNVRKVARS